MQKSIVVISGGTATNDIVSLFNLLPYKVTYVLPISDNGGSSSEIIRVIGGPAIGDIRSRLNKLIPDSHESYHQLFSYRLDQDNDAATTQWGHIIDGSHKLWRPIPLSAKELIRPFLLHLHLELLKKSGVFERSLSEHNFKFSFANVGNLFLTGVRLFTGSLESAIELFKLITGIDSNVDVLPCLNTNFSYHIGAILLDGSIITGQSQISHPGLIRHACENREFNRTSVGDGNLMPSVHKEGLVQSVDQKSMSTFFDEEVGNTPSYTHPELRKSQLHFCKEAVFEPLPSPIERVFYVSPSGNEISPAIQPNVASKLSRADIILYSVGSLLTSIVPIVLLRGSGQAIADEGPSKKRVLLLNGCEDRETQGLEAYDYAKALVESAQYSMKKSGSSETTKWSSFITHLFYIKSAKIHVDIDVFTNLGILCVPIKQNTNEMDRYDLEDLRLKLLEIMNREVV